MLLKEGNKKAQVTIFIIVAILIVAIVGVFFLLKDKIVPSKVPSDFQPAYENFVSCLKDELITGSKVLESQGGYIYLPRFESGSEYMPFSSQLNFLGNPVPYWYYVSGNNIQKEQIPNINSMQSELEKFVNSQVVNCIPENLDSDIELEVGKPSAKISIKSNEIQMNLDMLFNLRKGDTTSKFNNHEVIVDSDLGNLYDNALAVYDAEQSNMFLEDYAVDTLRLYAPVDGVEMSCSPKIWNANDVFNNLKTAISLNTEALKTSGANDDYFVVDSLRDKISSEVRVGFMNSGNWSSTFEVNPSDGFLMIANPVGNQQGLGVLGFCYVPYHFVYSVKYPVMVQVYSQNTDEIFQFPFAVVIQGNKPREALNSSAASYNSSVNVCENKNTDFSVRVYNQDSQRINDASISFDCFAESCSLGDTNNGLFEGKVPQCANSYITSRAEGYKDASVMVSTVNSGSVDIIMQKEYDLKVQLSKDSQYYNKEALVSFESSDGESQTLLYPEQNRINLSEGVYDISVRVYQNSSLKISGNVQQYCVDVPRTIGGSLGLTKQECYDVNVPDEVVSNALSGGGSQEMFISENDLKNSGQILIGVESLPEPDSLQQIQENNVLFDSSKLEVTLR
jgi:hypothetical protein